MTVYKNVNQINHLIRLIPDEWGIFIHVDKKSKINIKDIDNRAYIIKKWSIYWGSINHLKAVLDLLKIANARGIYDYYHIITGQDLIIATPTQFDEILDNKNNIYISCFDIPYERWKYCWGGGYWIYQRRTLALWGDVRYSVIKRLNNFFIKIQSKLNIYKKLPKYKLYGGALYCSLTKDAVYEVLNSKIGRHLLRNLKYSLCGEEIFFQTVLMNSKLKDHIINNNLRYVDWSVQNPPKVLDINDYPKIKKSNCLFCRKVEYPKSLELSRKLEKLLYDFYHNTCI